jgi:alkanesulfonate monooxygenase SsuD/methylene tetrahydromethanopterin reductase-like flavin-dependent oxidoreductase (luciferase family)
MTRPPLRVGVAYDFRNPPESGMSHPDFYAAVIEQIAWLDGIGLDMAWFTEHHFVEDGYLPSWTPVVGAVAARTKRLRFSSDVCLMPFNHPIRLAEDLAVLDNISNGRIELGAGMGYAPHEFKGFGLPVARRVSLTNEALDVLKLAFTGERFSYEGQRYSFKDVKITPGYVQPGGPPLWVAAMGRPGAERCARLGANLLPQGLKSDTLDVWSAGLKAAGGDPASRRIGIIRSCLVTDDRERDWPMVREGERRRMAVYNRFAAESGGAGGVASASQEDRIPQTWVIGDVDHCVAELSAFIAEYGVTDLVTWGVPPGLRPDQMAPHLERFVRDVAPRLKAVVNA